jgi:hypothetical protein
MSPHSPIQKNLIKKSHSIKAETRRAVSKLAKSRIIISKKKLCRKTRKKFKKFEIRNNKTVRLILGLFFVNKTWVSLHLMYGLVFCLKNH